MLSVRLPSPLETQLSAYCEAQHLSKSAVVQQALEKHLRLVAKPVRQVATVNPFTALRGTGNRKVSTEQVMQMTRGADWNQA
jgi:predicted transcriptional regulator